MLNVHQHQGPVCAQQKGEFLRYAIDLKRIDNVCDRELDLKVVRTVRVDKVRLNLPALSLAQVAGSVISMGLALGAILDLGTRGLYSNITM